MSPAHSLCGGAILRALRCALWWWSGQEAAEAGFAARLSWGCPFDRLGRYETGSNPNFWAGSQRMSHEVIVNVSLSNWFITPNEVASVRCGPLMS